MKRPVVYSLVLTASLLFAGGGRIVSGQVPDKRILRVIVLDSKDSAVSGARVTFRTANGEARECAETGLGEFECSVTGKGSLDIKTEAPGFRSFTRLVDLTNESDVRIELVPMPLKEQVVVSASGAPTAIGETAASIVSLGQEEFKASAAPSVDDVLRQTAGFSLYRRTDSRTANPTTQGTSLRGLNPSGASRAAVLVDSVPLNDPFGGWVPWSSVPPIAIDRVEVLRGGASSLYGSDSVGGIVSIIQKRATRKSVFSAETFGGTQGTASASAFGGSANRSIVIDGFGSIFHTDGYIPVEAGSRGLADERAGSRNLVLSARFAPRLPGKLNFFIRGSYFDESRKNGTRLQRNETLSRQMVVGADPEIGDPFTGTSNSALSIRFFALVQEYDQTFTAVSADRDTESLTRLQRVPSQSIGYSIRFSTAAGRHFFLTGIEGRETRGSSDETGFFGGNPTSNTGAGGRERTFAAYAQDRLRLGESFIVTGRVRIDRWRNFRALRSDLQIASGERSTTIFPDRAETALSPGISANFSLTDRVSAYLNASGSFRAPTLNELYRGFRVGNIVTTANEDLRSEKAINFEGGVSFWFEGISIRTGGYQTVVRDAVANVTVDPDSSPILRQRMNAAKIRVRGFEIEGQVRLNRLDIAFGYLLSEALITQFPGDAALVGNRLAQSPSQQVTFRAMYKPAGLITLGLQTRAASNQFDDDLNQFRLGGYFQADIFVSKRFGRAEAFGSIENLLDTRYKVGLTPVPTVGRPLTVRAGIRWN